MYETTDVNDEFDMHSDISVHVNEMNKLRRNDDLAKDDDIVNISSLRADNNSEVFNIIRNVLIVDDASMNRKMLRRILEDRVEMIYEAEDGQIAVNMIQDTIDNHEQSFDVILMDFVMPNMNGPEATRKIRELGYEGVIIGVTGNTLQSDIDEFKLHGANDVLPKPLDITVMESLLKGNTYSLLDFYSLFYNITLIMNIIFFILNIQGICWNLNYH